MVITRLVTYVLIVLIIIRRHASDTKTPNSENESGRVMSKDFRARGKVSQDVGVIWRSAMEPFAPTPGRGLLNNKPVIDATRLEWICRKQTTEV